MAKSVGKIFGLLQVFVLCCASHSTEADSCASSHEDVTSHLQLHSGSQHSQTEDRKDSLQDSPWCKTESCDKAKKLCLKGKKCCDRAKFCAYTGGGKGGKGSTTLPTTATTTVPTTTGTTTTTITTTTRRAVVAVTTGGFSMEVTNPVLFSESPGAAEAVQLTIAENAGVSIDEVFVNLTYVGPSLLQQAEQVDQGTVQIDYKIIQEFAEGEEDEAEQAAAENVDNLNAVDASTWTEDISTNVESEAAANFTIVVNEESVVTVESEVTDTVIVPTTTTTTRLAGFEFVGDGLAKAEGCTDCAPNYYQQTYLSINSIDLPYACGQVCFLAPCCFGYAYTTELQNGVYFCNIYTSNSTVWDAWTLYPSEYHSIGGVLPGTTGMTYKRTNNPMCPPETTTMTTTMFPDTTPGPR